MRTAHRTTGPRLAGSLWLLCLLAVFAGGCAGHAKKTQKARSALDANQPKEAQGLFNELLEVEAANELPDDLGGDKALFLLDRAMVSQQLAEYDNSAHDFEHADKQIEMLDFSRSKGAEIGKYLFSDDVGAYRARPYEKLFINTLNMVNFLVRGNLQGARVEARRFAAMQQYLKSQEDGDDVPEESAEARRASNDMLSPGSYLAGFTYEKSGNADEALRYYDEALAGQTYQSLQEPVRRLGQYSGYRSPRITPIIDGAEAPAEDDGTGELLVVLSYGRVPALYAKRMPIGLAITYASAFMPYNKAQQARRMAGQGLVTWINLPAMAPSPKSYADPAVRIDGTQVSCDGAMAVDDLVRKAWEAGRGPVVAAALTRAITRAAVGQGVQKAGGDGGLGVFLSLVTQATMTAVDTPDTRSWATLPARVGFVRMRVPAGKHEVRVDVLGYSQTATVEVEANGWAVANFTQLRMPPAPSPPQQ